MLQRSRIPALFLILLLSNTIFAQVKIDSLISALPHIKDDSTKAKTLNTICLRLVYSYPDSALKFAKISLQIGERSDNETIKARAYNVIGIIYDVTNKWDDALTYYDSSIMSAKIANDSIVVASVLNNQGLVYWNKSIYDKAIKLYMESLTLFEILGRKHGVANTYNNIGLIFGEQNRPYESIKYHFMSLKTRKEINDVYGMNDSWLNIANEYYDYGKPDSSVFYYHKVIPFFQSENNHYALGVAYNGLGVIYRNNKNYDQAINYLQKSIDEHIQVGNKYKAASSLISLSRVYHDLLDYDQEIQLLLKAKNLSEENSSLKLELKVWYLLAQANSLIGEYQLSNKYYLKHHIVSDSLYQVERDETIEQMKVSYETEKKEKALIEEQMKNELLEKENMLSEIKVSNRNRWLIAVIAFSVAVFFFFLFMNQRSKQKSQAERDLAIIKEREKGLKAVFSAQEAERARIAKDLHDGIGQQMSAIRLSFSSISDKITAKLPELKDKTEKINKVIIDTTNDVRSISHQMMPKALTEMGLALALEDLLEVHFTNTDLTYSFDKHGMENRLPAKVEVALFRIAQELFTNIIKHSGAKNIDIQLMKMKNHCLLIVHDDGVGISDNNASDGIGMQNMSNRLRTINGDLSIDSEVGDGTTATIKIALN